jgi:hypothetical protein
MPGTPDSPAAVSGYGTAMRQHAGYTRMEQAAC